MDKAVTYRAVTKSGDIYTVQIGSSPKNSKNRYIRIQAAQKPEEKADTEEKDEEEKPEEKPETDKINELNEKHGKWTYLIADYKAKDMLYTMDDLEKKKEEEE
jgi:hypothetical protein